jgi:hypothetical protein
VSLLGWLNVRSFNGLAMGIGWEKKGLYICFWLGKPLAKPLLEVLRRVWKLNTNIDLREIGCVD